VFLGLSKGFSTIPSEIRCSNSCHIWFADFKHYLVLTWAVWVVEMSFCWIVDILSLCLFVSFVSDHSNISFFQVYTKFIGIIQRAASINDCLHGGWWDMWITLINIHSGSQKWLRALLLNNWVVGTWGWRKRRKGHWFIWGVRWKITHGWTIETYSKIISNFSWENASNSVKVLRCDCWTASQLNFWTFICFCML
jgi:hypothetical protein